MTIDHQELYDLIQKEVASGNVREFRHNKFPELRGYDYTEKVKFDKLWNPINSICRGLVFAVIDDGAQRLNNPFPAIRNIEETSLTLESIKNDIASITSKEDGSCIICFQWDNSPHPCDDMELIVMTRGSFHSEQAIAAKKLIQTSGLLTNLIDSMWAFTTIFEYVGPSNLNVCRTKYQTDDLILLGARSNEWLNIEVDHKTLSVIWAKDLPRPTNYLYNDELYKSIKDCKDPNTEGVVIRLNDGLRYKVKSNMYCDLHKILTGIWTKQRILDIWYRAVKTGHYLNVVPSDLSIPDEFFTELKDRLKEVQEDYLFFRDKVKTRLLDYAIELSSNSSRKDMALKYPDTTWMLKYIFSETEEITEQIIEDVYYKKQTKEN